MQILTLRNLAIAAFVVGVGYSALDVKVDTPAMASADPVRITVTVKEHGVGYADITVRNNTDAIIESASVHCTFRDDVGKRIDSVPVLVTDIAAGDTATERARMPQSVWAYSVSCRVGTVRT
jgi:hypothetical protein